VTGRPLALGATVEIETVGPLPLLNYPAMEGLFERTAASLVVADQ
jgi:hypothetical protein